MNIPDLWARALDDFSVSLISSGRSQSTIDLRLYQLRRLAAEVDRGPFDVTLDDLTEFLSVPSWRSSTRRSMRAAIRTFYGWALRAGRVDRDPSAALLPIRVPRNLPRPTPEHVLERALAGADERVALMLEFGARAGLRAGEIAACRREDVVELLVGHGLRIIGKGDRERLVPLHDELAERLLAMPPGPFFPGQIDGHLSAGYVTRLMSRALGGGGAHQTRHRFATRALRGSGHNLRVVQELLGHTSIATTQIYTAVTDDEMRLAVLAV